MPRSLWGWGDAERFPDLDKLTRRAAPFFGELTLQKPSTEVRAPAPRVAVPQGLSAFATADLRERAAHCWGKSYADRVKGFYGDYSASPDFVATPRDEADVERALDVAQRERLAVIPFGGGTSVVRGVEPELGPGHLGVLSLDLRRLDRVLEVDPVSRAARVQAGVLGPHLEQQLKPTGLTLRHFLQSFEFSTLGGWIATRAAGHFATVTTHIDHMVESLRMLTPTGVWQSRRLPASGAGPKSEAFVLGSEGALGVITEAWIRLHAAPTHRAGASVHFAELKEGVAAVRELSQSGLYPTNCRLLDPNEVMINGVALDGSSVLVLGFESADHPVEPWLNRALAIAASHGGTVPEAAAGTGDSGERWSKSFLEGPYLMDGLISLGVMVETFETACTWAAFDPLYGEVTEAVMAALARCSQGGAVSCRLTHVYPDGPAPYFTWFGRARRGAEVEQWAEVKRAATDAVMKAGGTVTHHHAVGRTHAPWWKHERPEPFARALIAMKRELDPSGIMNPGVLA